MADSYFSTFSDHNGEKATVSLNVVDITAANIAAQTALATALQTAAAGVTLGTRAKSGFSIINPGSANWPSNPLAQREEKWLVTYTDTSLYLDPGPNTVPNPSVGKLFSVEWPCPDLGSSHLKLNSDFADLAETDVAAFVTAFEAFAKSPNGGNVSVVSMKLVGRNL